MRDGGDPVSGLVPVVHRILWRMWISPFSHAFRLTMVVDKALTTATTLDSGHGHSVSEEDAVLQVLLLVVAGSGTVGRRSPPIRSL
jgi:hypothetical protein